MRKALGGLVSPMQRLLPRIPGTVLRGRAALQAPPRPAPATGHGPPMPTALSAPSLHRGQRSLRGRGRGPWPHVRASGWGALLAPGPGGAAVAGGPGRVREAERGPPARVH